MVGGERAGEVEEVLGYHLEQAYRYRVELTRMDERARAIALRAAARLGAAGRRALAKGDLGAATNLLDRALGLTAEKAEAWLDLAVELGIALREAGDFRRAQRLLAEALEVARRLGDRRAEVVVVIQRAEATVLSDPSRADEVLSEVEAAMPVLEEVGEDRTLATAWVLLGQFRGVGVGRFAYAEEAYERALGHARKAHDRREEAKILGWLAFVALFGPRPVGDAAARCRSIIDEAQGEPLVEAGVLRALCALEARRGNFEEARSLAYRARRLYEEIGVGGVLPLSITFALADIELLAEDYEAAERELRRGREVLERIGERGLRSTVMAMLARAVFGQGRVDEAEALALEGRPDAPERDIWWSIGAGALANVLAARGEHEQAEALARETVALLEPTDGLDLRGGALADLAEVLLAAGRTEDASGAAAERSSSTSARGTWPPRRMCGGGSRPLGRRQAQPLQHRRVGRRRLERGDVQGRHRGHVPGGEVGERETAHQRVEADVRRRLVEHDLVVGRVQLEQPLDEDGEPGRLRLRRRRVAADRAHLPEDERRGRVDDAPADEEVGRLVASGSPAAPDRSRGRRTGSPRRRPPAASGPGNPPLEPGGPPRATERRRPPGGRRRRRRPACPRGPRPGSPRSSRRRRARDRRRRGSGRAGSARSGSARTARRS